MAPSRCAIYQVGRVLEDRTDAALRRPPRDDFAAGPVLRLRSVMWTNCFRKIMRIPIARVVLARASRRNPQHELLGISRHSFHAIVPCQPSRVTSRSQLRCCPGSVMIEMMRPRARASRDITVPSDTPVTSAISR